MYVHGKKKEYVYPLCYLSFHVSIFDFSSRRSRLFTITNRPKRHLKFSRQSNVSGLDLNYRSTIMLQQDPCTFVSPMILPYGRHGQHLGLRSFLNFFCLHPLPTGYNTAHLDSPLELPYSPHPGGVRAHPETPQSPLECVHSNLGFPLFSLHWIHLSAASLFPSWRQVQAKKFWPTLGSPRLPSFSFTGVFYSKIKYYSTDKKKNDNYKKNH